MKKFCIIMVVLAASISGCEMLSDHIWTEYIWKVENNHYNPAPLDTGLPVVKITTAESQTIKSRENYIDAMITITDPDNQYTLEETQTQIRGRGNTTWWYPKKPYRIKFYEKQSLFGLTKAKSWVLLANHQDPTLMMNTIAFELGRRMDLPYTNHAVPVEVILNGAYEGSYVLTEQVQVGKGRVDIDEDDGFLVELDSYYDEEPKFRTPVSQLPVMIKSPEDLTDPAGYDFVKEQINDLEAAVFSGEFPGNGYRDLIDMDTFVKLLLINQIVGNTEAGIPKSVYMYKDKGDKKISMGPLWDFDWGFGYSGEGNVYFEKSDYLVGWHPFFTRLFDDPVFAGRYKELWNAYYEDIAGIGSFIDETAAMLEASQRENFTRWQWLNKPVYANEIAKMKIWWNARVSYLNAEINNE
jgi:spore coat protein CotH